MPNKDEPPRSRGIGKVLRPVVGEARFPNKYFPSPSHFLELNGQGPIGSVGSLHFQLCQGPPPTIWAVMLRTHKNGLDTNPSRELREKQAILELLAITEQ